MGWNTNKARFCGCGLYRYSAIRGLAWEKNGVLEPGCIHEYYDKELQWCEVLVVVKLSQQFKRLVIVGEVVEVIDDGKGVKGEIVGVVGCDSYSSCKSCKAMVVEVSDVVWECSKCGMKVKMNRYTRSVAARLGRFMFYGCLLYSGCFRVKLL